MILEVYLIKKGLLKMKKKWKLPPTILLTILLIFNATGSVFAANPTDNDNIFQDYEFDILSKYKDKIVFKQEEEVNVNLNPYSQYRIGLYYHDTELAESDIPLVFIMKVSKKDWEINNLKSWLGAHERADMKGQWVYIWSLPGEHPYEPYGLHHFEAKEFSTIFEEILKVLEGSSDNASTVPSKNKVFEDVNGDHYAYEAILWAKENGIVSGYSNGTFRPNEKVTEAQFAKMLANFFELSSVDKTITKNPPNESWSDDVYNSLAAYGIPLNGYFDNAIRNKPVKRGVVAQALAYLSHSSANLNDSIQFLLDNEISTGQNLKDKNNLLKYFGYNNDLTRAQAVTFLYRMQKSGLNQVSNSVKSSLNSIKNSSLNDLAKQSIAKIHHDLLAKSTSTEATSATIKGGLMPKEGLILTYNPSVLNDGKEVFIVEKSGDFSAEKSGNTTYLKNITNPGDINYRSYYYYEDNENIIMGLDDTDWQFFILSYPMKQGEYIKDTYFDSEDYTMKYRKVFVETTTATINVKAGTFNNVVVLRSETGLKHYFAEGIGLIRSTDKNGKIVTELSSIKEDKGKGKDKITTTEAEQLVRNHLGFTNDPDILVEYDHDEQQHYIIQVFKFVGDPPIIYTQTYGWYRVDPFTGEIYKNSP